MKWKRVGAALLLGTMLTATASAEQPAAQQYRDMIQKRDFAVQYTENGHNYIYAMQGSKIVNRQQIRRHRAAKSVGQGLTALASAIISHAQMEDAWICAACADDKGYYRRFTEGSENEYEYDSFLPKKVNPSQLEDNEENWPETIDMLRVPAFLAVFAGKQVSLPASMSPIRFQGSSSKTENNTAYVCDRYVSQVKNAQGGNHGQVVYDVWYQGDKLQRIQSSYVAPDGKESILDAAYITSLQNATPDALQLENVRVYEAEIGTVQEVYGETTYMGGLKDLVDGKGGKK